MSEPELHPDSPRARFRRTLVRVLVVQAVTLTILAILQILYS